MCVPSHTLTRTYTRKPTNVKIGLWARTHGPSQNGAKMRLTQTEIGVT